MPSSRSPKGIQFDSPLQRQWMIFESSGSSRRNDATVAGAASSSKRATKRKSPACDLDHGPTLAPCSIQRPSSSRSASVIPVAFPSGITFVRTASSLDRVGARLDLLRRVELDAERRGRERGVGRARGVARRAALLHDGRDLRERHRRAVLRLRRRRPDGSRARSRRTASAAVTGIAQIVRPR